MKHILIMITACLFAFGAFGQEGKTVSELMKEKDPREQCLMATGADWARLGVDQEQIMRVNAIQSSCLQDCVAAREGAGDVSAVMDRHIEELRRSLSPEQFEKWSKWCNNKIEASGGGGGVQ
jgi:hypothetical protein